MLLGGVAADRSGRARLMVLAETVAAVAQLVAATLFLTGRATVPWLAVLAAVGGVATAMFFPAFTGLVPEVAADAELQSANALLRLASNVASILGTAVGGVLVATIGSGWALVIDALTFGVSAVLLRLVRAHRPAPPEAKQGTLADLRDGWQEFTARRWVVVIVVLAAVSNVGFSAAVGVLGPVQADAALGGPGPWAVIVAAFGLGTVAGVVVALRLRPNRPLLVATAVAPVMVLPVAAMAPPTPLAVIAGLAFLGGVAADVFGVLWDTALQQHVPGDSLSRVSAYDWFGSIALVPLGLAAAGPLVAAVGVEKALWVAFGLGAVLVLALLDPDVRGLRAGRPADVPPPG
jgi:predicted MFS family arabinose efflux permease